VEAALDKRSSMGILGDMNKFTQFQVAESMEAAAKNPSGGGASTGMGMGMGFGMANAMMGQMGQSGQQPQPGLPPIPGVVSYFVAIGGQQSGPFDQNILKQMAVKGEINKDTMVWKQGMSQWAAASAQPDLVSIFDTVPPPLPQK
jgi:hypothetical protein